MKRAFGRLSAAALGLLALAGGGLGGSSVSPVASGPTVSPAQAAQSPSRGLPQQSARVSALPSFGVAAGGVEAPFARPPWEDKHGRLLRKLWRGR